MRDHIHYRLAHRLEALRRARDWSLDDLAARSGVSRATLSRIEKGQTSPTAAVLGTLCPLFGRTMSQLMADAETIPSALLRRADQAVWEDTETGFRRRAVSPPAAGYAIDVIEGTLRPGAEIAYDAPAVAGHEHHLVMLAGLLGLTIEGQVFALSTGDSIRYRLFGPSRFNAPGPSEARYLLAMSVPGGER
ncbi:putative transcriptional regulator [Ameyamaea chiangmaiensis NBRC 103196]|uniref:Helix-turn-helix transcriptional regulator n=1 Tax=Ameyamaea chiangmaiensis TaxID=442969 RepID=A0A850P7M9_9PROT|nr:XRE family transcriptional regulator [Ameyamaea chiangmaiensis]MBS4073857.1 helix-turn-helix transcriptional regulator [Ameyamaea chiangmaiensis]NVN40615.1 helix-turn-helix transcriptional regulator [Ameyamaea chiangmaiensis]GBQ68166.1 putative transcriptional regulator [Ameyamaea chiangmaiensis NBRC 103196]